MSYMFYKCSSLINLDISNFNTQNVFSFTGIFEEWASLTNLNLSNFNTQSLFNMMYMFKGCPSNINIMTKDHILLNELKHYYSKYNNYLNYFYNDLKIIKFKLYF